MDRRVKVMGMISPNWVSQSTGITFDERYFIDPEYRVQEDARMVAWLTEFDSQLADRFESYGVEWCPIGISGIGGVFDNLAPGVVAVGLPQSFILVVAMFGGELVYFDADNPDVKGYPLAGVEHPDEIYVPDVANTWPVSLYLDQYEQMVAKYGRDRAKLFCDIGTDGMPNWYLHSPLTIAYRLRGDQLFIDMVEKPKLAARILDVALETAWQLFRLYESLIGKKIEIMPIATCIATLISPSVYEEWEIPRLRQLIEHYGAAKIHSCGPSTHVLKPLATLPNLVEIELGAGTDMAVARQLWPDATLNYLIDTPKFVYHTPEQVRTEVKVACEQAGGPLVILWPAETGTPLETIGAIYEAVADYNRSLQ